MKLLDVYEALKDQKKGRRRLDLFRRENLETRMSRFLLVA